MASDDDDFDLKMLGRYGSGATADAAARKKAEAKKPAPKDRRLIKRSDRTAQLGMKVTPEFKRLLGSLADAAGLLQVEYVEQAVKLKAEADKKRD